MFRLFILLCTLFLSYAFTIDEDPYFHSVPALAGDSVYSLLDRYKLADHNCNYSKFYALNKLKKGSGLYKGKKYKIPVYIYRYNGKSIRTTIGIKGWEQALRIKKYNERLLSKNLRKRPIASSKIVWVAYHELKCLNDNANKKEKEIETVPVNTEVEATNPDNPPREEYVVDQKKINDQIIARDKKLSGHRKFPIFGDKNAYVPLKNNRLKNRVFYIVGGHGGPDSGAVGKKGNKQLCEDEYAYDISLRIVRNILEEGGIAYVITRDPNDGIRSGSYLPCDTDEYCWGNYVIPRGQKSRLFQRSNAVNKLYEKHLAQGLTDQTVVAIHIDARGVNQRADVFFYYFPGSKEGRALAKGMQRTLAKYYKKYRSSGRYHGTVTARDLHMLREPKPNAVYVELGNIKNKVDQQRFIMESNRQALANWLFEGLTK